MEQILAILVPQITKDIAMSQHAPAERVQMSTVERDQPGDQVRRDSAAVHRQGCSVARCDATTGPSPPVPPIQEQLEEVAKTFSERIVAKTTDLPVPQILKEVAEGVKAVNTEVQEETYEVIKLPPSESFLESTAEQVVQVPVPQALEEAVEVVKALKNDVPTPQILKEIVEAFSAPHQQVQQLTVEHRSVEQTVEEPTPQILEEIVEATSATHEHVQQRTAEHRIAAQTLDAPTPQILQEIVEATPAPHERVQQRTAEHRIVVQTVDSPTPQTLEEIVEAISAVKNVPQEPNPEGIGVKFDDIVVDQLGDQAGAATGPSDTDGFEDCDSPADAVHRPCGDAATGPSFPDGDNDGEYPIDQPGDRARRDSADSFLRPGPDGGRHSGGCARDHADYAVGTPGGRGARGDATTGTPAVAVRKQTLQFPSLFGATSSAGQAGLAAMSRRTAAEPDPFGGPGLFFKRINDDKLVMHFDGVRCTHFA